MAKNTGIRKTIELLLKKVETLENQSFGQKLLIDELENKLLRTEETIKQIKDPFGWGQPGTPPWSSAPAYHTCQQGPLDSAGFTHCTICGTLMHAPSWTVTTTDNTSSSIDVTSVQSSTDVEPTLDLDISWIVADGTNE